MKKILVQKQLTIAAALLISLFIIALGILFIFFVFNGYLNFHNKLEVMGFIGAAAFFIPLWLSNANSNKRYVSELILSDDTLTVVYRKKNNIVKEKAIKLTDIESVHAKLNANRAKISNSIFLFCETEVKIRTKDDKTISFKENPTARLTFCSYDFMLRFIKFAKNLPNFTYEVIGNSEAAKEDVKHYAMYGRRISYFKREWINFMQLDAQSRRLITTLFVLFFFCIGFVFYIFLLVPNIQLFTKNEYVSFIDHGYELYQNNLYEQSLREYDKALNIHDDDYRLYYYRALSYEKNKQYEKAIIEANKGIAVLDKKSAYHNAKRKIFVKKDDVGLYDVVGDCNKKLKRYEEAKKAFDYVIENVRYAYTDAYFKRGQCEFYLNQKEAALRDFYRHKRIIEKSIQAGYSVYNQNHLTNINKWIEACLAH